MAKKKTNDSVEETEAPIEVTTTPEAVVEVTEAEVGEQPTPEVAKPKVKTTYIQ
jgi:hypothetical protein